MRPYTQARYPIGNGGEYIPANPEIGSERDPNVQPAQAMTVDQDGRTFTNYNPETQELIFFCYRNELGKDEINTSIRDARARYGTVKKVVAYLCQEAYATQLFWLDKNQFVRDIVREKAGHICVVKDLTAPKKPMPKVEALKPSSTPTPTPEPTAAPSTATPLSTEEIKLEIAEVGRQIAILGSSANPSPSYYREFETIPKK
jgi:hypothetical protein